jgi:hypothetical protein
MHNRQTSAITCFACQPHRMATSPVKANSISQADTPGFVAGLLPLPPDLQHLRSLGWRSISDCWQLCGSRCKDCYCRQARQSKVIWSVGGEAMLHCMHAYAAAALNGAIAIAVGQCRHAIMPVLFIFRAP